jgi:hypothetical protein
LENIFRNTKLQSIELDIFDQNDLEERFVNGDLDLIVTSRTPGKQKFKHLIEVGYQSLDRLNTNENFSVMSPYEFGQMKKKPENKTLISNSLSIRREWLKSVGGQGIVPSGVIAQKSKDLMPVFVLAAELFNESLWGVVQKTELIS